MAAAALVAAPNIDWTEDDGLYRRVELFSRDVEDMMLGPLTTYTILQVKSTFKQGRWNSVMIRRKKADYASCNSIKMQNTW